MKLYLLPADVQYSRSTHVRLFTMIAAMVIVLWLPACGGGGGAESSTSNNSGGESQFNLSSSQPAHGTNFVPDSSPITLTFSENVAPGSVTGKAIRLSSRDGSVDAAIATLGKQITLTPTRRLAPGETYTVTVERDIVSTKGKALAQVAVLQFTTAGGTWQSPLQMPVECAHPYVGKPVLLADGSLLIRCGIESAPIISRKHIWLRDHQMNWRIIASEYDAEVRQLDDQQAQIDYYIVNQGAVEFRRRIYNQTTGLGSPLVVNPDDYNRRVITAGGARLSVMTRGTVSTGANSRDILFSVVSNSDNSVLSTFSTESAVNVQWSGCGFPDGTIAVVYKVAVVNALSTPLAPSFTWRLRGLTYQPSTGWTTSSPLRQGSTSSLGAPDIPVIDDPGYQICAASGTARFMYHGQIQFEKYMINWTQSAGWSVAPLFTGNNGYATSDQFSESLGGGVLHAISDYIGRDANNNEIWVSRIYEAPLTSSGWRTVLGAPSLMSSGASSNIFVSSITYNPRTNRYLVSFSTMQPGNQSRWYFSDYSSLDGWSVPWTAPAVLDGSSFDFYETAFNASGNGVLVQRHWATGQYYLREWR